MICARVLALIGPGDEPAFAFHMWSCLCKAFFIVPPLLTLFEIYRKDGFCFCISCWFIRRD